MVPSVSVGKGTSIAKGAASLADGMSSLGRRCPRCAGTTRRQKLCSLCQVRRREWPLSYHQEWRSDFHGDPPIGFGPWPDGHAVFLGLFSPGLVLPTPVCAVLPGTGVL